MKVRLIRFLLALATLLGPGVMARAHGPFDSSSQLIILSDALELNATLGMQGAKQLLLNAGLSEADATTALSVRGPSTLHDLSADLAPHFFEIKAGDRVLKAKRMQVITDGLEASFIATYAGSYSGDLEVRARYFDGSEAMKPGAFIALDENQNAKGGAMLSRSKTVATVKLSAPAAVPTPVVTEVPNSGDPVAVVSNVTSAAQTAPVAAPSQQPSTLWWAGGLLVAVVVILVLVRKISHAR